MSNSIPLGPPHATNTSTYTADLDALNTTLRVALEAADAEYNTIEEAANSKHIDACLEAHKAYEDAFAVLGTVDDWIKEANTSRIIKR